MQRHELLEKVQDLSSFLKIELGNVERDRNCLIKNVRGNGTFLGFDTETPMAADSIQSWLQKSAIQVARIGPSTLGVRPALVLGASKAHYLRDSLRAYHPNHSKN